MSTILLTAVKCYNKPLMKTHIVFDLDDTITNSYQFNQQMFVDTFVPHVKNLATHEAYLRDLHFKSKGTPMHIQFKTAMDYMGVDADPARLIKENEVMHLNNIEKVDVFEATHELLDLLKKKGKVLILCSNRGQGSLKKVLERHKLFEYFDDIISCADACHEKPSPHCLLELVQKYNVPKENFLCVGDSKTDVEFATAAGIDFIIIDQYMNQKKFFKMLVETFF